MREMTIEDAVCDHRLSTPEEKEQVVTDAKVKAKVLLTTLTDQGIEFRKKVLLVLEENKEEMIDKAVERIFTRRPRQFGAGEGMGGAGEGMRGPGGGMRGPGGGRGGAYGPGGRRRGAGGRGPGQAGPAEEE